MNKLLDEVVGFFSEGLPMSPAASWFLIGSLLIVAFVATMAIGELDLFTQLAAYNVKEAGLKGVWYAMCGNEVNRIRKERVIEVSRHDYNPESDDEDNWYVVHTSDGKYSADYYIIPTYIKNGSEEKAHVESYFALEDKETGARSCFFVVRLKYRNAGELEEVLNEYFEEEYREERRRALKSHKKSA